ncbi:hypothetical protein Aspvir_003793 [Aspergillus viridinutans]|uniref:Uncharacterized protein n=1 Tax=Aspergillus viridinutans TaxID=75553 RepID=A0A9P3BTR5_ASPVI|nr:uncharacterized protein Aspvir_003793 [Aspergillus viridinutans]GIJ99790.1 hypothetical protein Aspvir_003793 [Aspergillus viridinutans]
MTSARLVPGLDDTPSVEIDELCHAMLTRFHAKHRIWRVLGLEACTLSRNETPYMPCGLPHGTKPQRVLAEEIIEVVNQLFCSCVGTNVFDSMLLHEPAASEAEE